MADEGRRPGRRPGPTETRAAILAAARELFAQKGYEGASMRAIARAAEVDPALVHHFFGGKEGLFVAAMEFPFNPAELLPQIIAGPREEIGERMVRTFLLVWGDPEIQRRALAVIRSAATTEQGAAMLREFIAVSVLGPAAEVLGIPPLRIIAAVSQMIGVVLIRYVVRVEAIAEAPDDELVALLAPALQRYLDA
jgi:AcrR family transcriptional regulator